MTTTQFYKLAKQLGAVVVAQLAQQLLLTPEVLGSNPVIGEINIEHCLLSSIEKTKKRPRMAHLKKTKITCLSKVCR